MITAPMAGHGIGRVGNSKPQWTFVGGRDPTTVARLRPGAEALPVRVDDDALVIHLMKAGGNDGLIRIVIAGRASKRAQVLVSKERVCARRALRSTPIGLIRIGDRSIAGRQ